MTNPPDESTQREQNETLAPRDGPGLLVDDTVPRLSILTLSRPARKNALTRELVLDLTDAFEAIARSHSVSAVILTGKGGSFCSGVDLSTVQQVPAAVVPDRIEEFHRLIRAIVGLPQPVIAAIDGAAVGFGADLALCCDVRLFSERAYLQESFVKVGLMPDGGGTHWLPRYFGPRAFELLALGDAVTAEECRSVGIANRVIDGARLLEEARALAERFADGAPLAIQAIKRALRVGEEEHLIQSLHRERLGQTRLLASKDFAEGVEAFLGKRKPTFTGE